MPWYTIAALITLAACAIGDVLLVGKPRKRKTSLEAAGDVIMIGLLMWAVVAGASA